VKNDSISFASAPRVQNYPDGPLSPEGLATWLRVSRRFLEVEVEKGKLRARRISPRLIRFLPGDVAQWLEAAASMQDEPMSQAVVPTPTPKKKATGCSV
jgi:hypothetical protein